MFKEGDWVLIRYEDRRYLRKLQPKGSINVRTDVLKFSQIVGKPPGTRVGKFELFYPTLEEIITLGFERKTQIIYPKDAFFIAFKLGLEKSKRVLEFGTGSGALCAVLSTLAGEVYTYEVEERFYRLAMKNLRKFGLGDNVRFHREDFLHADVPQSFFDCAFVDLKDPTPYIDKLHVSLRDGSPVGFPLPTANQVIELMKVLRDRFGGIEVLEILVRNYKTTAERFRPQDTMVGHTAYLLFCRKLIA